MKDDLLRLLDAVTTEQPLSAAARKAAALLRDAPVVEIGQSREDVAAADLARDYAARVALFGERGIERPGMAGTAECLAQCRGPVRIFYVDCELGSLTLLVDVADDRLVGCTLD